MPLLNEGLRFMYKNGINLSIPLVMYKIQKPLLHTYINIAIKTKQNKTKDAEEWFFTWQKKNKLGDYSDLAK